MSSSNAPAVAAAPAAPASDVPAVAAVAVTVEAQGAAPPGGIVGGIVAPAAPAAAAPPAAAAAAAAAAPKPVKQSRVQQQLQNLQLPDVIGPRTVIPGFTWVKRPKPTFERKCTYGKCPKPTESAHFFRIEEGRTAGGQDWTNLIGMVLCEACYGQYKKRGTLERGGTKASLDPKRKRCTFDGCDKPEESSHFYLIEPGKTAGGRDWTPLVGNVLCHTCYCRWKNRGTFDRVLNRPVDPKLRTCSWKDCERPTESKSYAKIEPGKKTGGQDWSSLEGSVLCNACYKRFKDRGTLEKHHRGSGNNSASSAGANNPTTPKKQAAQALAGLAAAAAAAAQEDTKGKAKQAARPAASPTASPAKVQAVPAVSPAKDAAAAPAAAVAATATAQAKTVDLGKQKVTVTVKPVVAKGKAAGKVEAAKPTEATIRVAEQWRAAAASKAPAAGAASGAKVGKATTSKAGGAGGAGGKAAAVGTKRTAASASLEAEGRDALAAAAAAAGATGKGKRAKRGAAGAGGEGPAGQGKDITECVVM